MSRWHDAIPALVCSLVSACVADDVTRDAYIQAPRILAVVAEPAEAAPGDEVSFRALVVAPEGPVAAARWHWSFCLTPRALTENSSVSKVCATSDEKPLAGRDAELQAVIPEDACARFGSETSLGLRPLDPDHSGGYYQPLRLSASELRTTIVRQRILCPLANAPIDVAIRFAQSYVANTNPSLEGLRLTTEDGEVAAAALPAHTKVALAVEVADDARESYPLYDALSGELSTRTETLRARWFVTQGELALDESDVSGRETNNELTTPEAGSALWLWVVVRDDRGGVSVLEQALTVSD